MLRERLELQVLTTEDSIRYTFYAALLSSGDVTHTEIVVEHPHPTIEGAQIDSVIHGNSERKSIAVEFKYDRGNPGGTNQNRTQRAAAVLVDLFRLAKVPDSAAVVKYFIYVTDSEMAAYFKNPSNRLGDFFEMNEQGPLTLGLSRFIGFSKTLVDRVQPFACDCQVVKVFAAHLPADHHLRVFQVVAQIP
jgi:hypothetical protein